MRMYKTMTAVALAMAIALSGGTAFAQGTATTTNTTGTGTGTGVTPGIPSAGMGGESTLNGVLLAASAAALLAGGIYLSRRSATR